MLVIRYCHTITLNYSKEFQLLKAFRIFWFWSILEKSFYLSTFARHIMLILHLDWLLKHAYGFLLWKFSLGFGVTQADSISLFYSYICIWCHSIGTKANWCNAIICVRTQIRFYLPVDYSYLFSLLQSAKWWLYMSVIWIAIVFEQCFH